MIKAIDAADVPDTRYLDNIIRPGGEPRAVPAAELAAIHPDHIIVWCVQNATYVIPTEELVEWLKARIGNRTAIEVGSGRNGLGKLLGIRSTDSYMQTRPEVRMMYAMAQQPIIEPPPYVEKIDAVDAVRKYQPEVVVGAFITHKWVEGITPDGNMWGPDEAQFLLEAKEYIHVGNLGPHKNKPLLALPHFKQWYPWLYTRGFDPALNRIMVWNDTGKAPSL